MEQWGWQEYPPEPKHSGFGIWSLVISLLAGLGIILVFAVATAAEMASPGSMQGETPQTMLLGLAIIGLMMIDIVAFLLGVASLFQQNRKKALGGCGLGCSGMTLFAVIGLILLGLLMS
ncbi:hypothetical protein KQI84_13420 [bacterium]|nr:hypothetical protein [bacterium]